MISILFAASVATAQTQTQGGCESVYETAYTLMQARQSGLPLPELFKKIDKIYLEKNSNEALKGLAKDAYSSPHLYGDKSKKRANVEFANKWFVICEG